MGYGGRISTLGIEPTLICSVPIRILAVKLLAYPTLAIADFPFFLQK